MRQPALRVKFIIFFLAIFSWLILSAKGKVDKVDKDPKKVYSSYSQCKKAGLAKLETDEWGKNKLWEWTAHCNEVFPLAALYQECKKKAIKSAGKDSSALKKKIKECKKELEQLTLSDDNLVPFVFRDNNMYFADQGLNLSIDQANLYMTNFDCSKALEDSKDPENAEFFLFGNHLRWFEGFRGKGLAAVAKALQLPKKIPESGFYISGLGKIYRDIQRASSSIFFPTTVCSYSKNPPAPYSGLSVYFLIEKNKQAQKLHPYVGASFYRPGFSGIDVKEATKILLERLSSNGGDPYKKMPSKKGDSIFYLSQNSISDFDDEGDPRDVCKLHDDPKKRHHYIAVIKSNDTTPKFLDYILIANIEKLCAFGDTLSRTVNYLP